MDPYAQAAMSPTANPLMRPPARKFQISQTILIWVILALSASVLLLVVSGFFAYEGNDNMAILLAFDSFFSILLIVLIVYLVRGFLGSNAIRKMEQEAQLKAMQDATAQQGFNDGVNSEAMFNGGYDDYGAGYDDYGGGY